MLAVGNNKGGVGKTTAVVGLAAAVARRGLRVLVVDMDPQANLSRRMGLRPGPGEPEIATVSEAIKADRDGCAASAILPARWEHPCAELVDFLPSAFDLENRVSEAGTLGALGRLARALRGVVEGYDVVLIDCPPSLGHLTQLALVAADGVLIVAVPEYDAIEGAIRLRDFVDRHAGDLGRPDLAVAGVVTNLVRGVTGLHAHHLDTIREAFGPLCWEPVLQLRTALAEANDAALPIYAWPGPAAATLGAAFDDFARRLAPAGSDPAPPPAQTTPQPTADADADPAQETTR